jgi:K+-sensing histidine kinase KdpD
LHAQNVSLALDLVENLPLVEADRTQLQQVVVNLAVNAVQAMAQPAAPRRLIVRSAGAGNSVVVAIEDNGCGLCVRLGREERKRQWRHTDNARSLILELDADDVTVKGGREGGTPLTRLGTIDA